MTFYHQNLPSSSSSHANPHPVQVKKVSQAVLDVTPLREWDVSNAEKMSQLFFFLCLDVLGFFLISTVKKMRSKAFSSLIERKAIISHQLRSGLMSMA